MSVGAPPSGLPSQYVFECRNSRGGVSDVRKTAGAVDRARADSRRRGSRRERRLHGGQCDAAQAAAVSRSGSPGASVFPAARHLGVRGCRFARRPGVRAVAGDHSNAGRFRRHLRDRPWRHRRWRAGKHPGRQRDLRLLHAARWRHRHRPHIHGRRVCGRSQGRRARSRTLAASIRGRPECGRARPHRRSRGPHDRRSRRARLRARIRTLGVLDSSGPPKAEPLLQWRGDHWPPAPGYHAGAGDRRAEHPPPAHRQRGAGGFQWLDARRHRLEGRAVRLAASHDADVARRGSEPDADCDRESHKPHARRRHVPAKRFRRTSSAWRLAFRPRKLGDGAERGVGVSRRRRGPARCVLARAGGHVVRQVDPPRPTAVGGRLAGHALRFRHCARRDDGRCGCPGAAPGRTRACGRPDCRPPEGDRRPLGPALYASPW